MKEKFKKIVKCINVILRKASYKVKMAGVALSTLAIVNVLPFVVSVNGTGTIDVSAITKPFDILKTIIYALVGGLGSIVLILGVVDLFTSISSHDVGGIKAGGFKVGAGVALVGITTIMALMGF